MDKYSIYLGSHCGVGSRRLQGRCGQKLLETRRPRRAFLALAFSLSLASLALAEVEQQNFVVDTAGGRVSGGTLSGVVALGQPGGYNASKTGDAALYAGFLAGGLKEEQDSDGDGVADELDADNDNDQLDDDLELAGTVHNPVTPTDINSSDTDGDGSSDAEEAFAGTNPTNENSFLEIIALEQGVDPKIEWMARGGKTYRIVGADDPSLFPQYELATGVPASGGVGPWYETSATYTDALPVASMRMIAIEPEP